MTQDSDKFKIFWPRHAVPGALVVVGTIQQAERLLTLERNAKQSLYSVRAILSDHIPLKGSLTELIEVHHSSPIALNEPSLTMYLHRGGDAAVFFDFCSDGDEHLSYIRVEVEADAPLAAFQAARTAVNQLLDTLMRRVWLPLVIARLDLFDSAEDPLASQLLLPFPSGLRIGPLGGIHQYPAFSELESLAREAICATSPYYRLLCAHRLYDGTGHVRSWLRKTAENLNIDEPLPKDLPVDQALLEGLGFPAEARKGIRKVNDLHGKLTDLRNQVAHFLLSREGSQSPLHVSDGHTYLVFSIAGAALLHYGFLTLNELSAYCRQHLGSHLARGSILPLKEQRARFRVVAQNSQTSSSTPDVGGGTPQDTAPA
ncbi:hypothetical protein [Rhodoferax sp.]|uniref:hypothetical protein n=1 Tax=Rhodoferax sp. TaxID=50421 RepID=UPI00273210A6|nr:hypothetical protein [Rhodoferax sp.]MDP1655372.1 hypothetical protein [Hylemonella sp.]MDP1945457.1 hypothetical protein [Rhodoferax sp.]